MSFPFYIQFNIKSLKGRTKLFLPDKEAYTVIKNKIVAKLCYACNVGNDFLCLGAHINELCILKGKIKKGESWLL